MAAQQAPANVEADELQLRNLVPGIAPNQDGEQQQAIPAPAPAENQPEPVSFFFFVYVVLVIFVTWTGRPGGRALQQKLVDVSFV